MKSPVLACLFVCVSLAAGAATAAPPSAYAGQEARDIKALSAADVEAYLTGKGMGLAKAAELNGYPGPTHVLELAPQLQLTPAQQAKTEALFASMQERAAALGRALVDAELRLDRLFASRKASPELLAASLDEIGALHGRVRGAHLEAHLAQVQILTPQQTVRYGQLRGYTAADTPVDHRHGHKH